VALSAGVRSIEALELQLVELDGSFSAHRELVVTILQDIVGSVLSDVVGQGFLQRVPLPAFDLSMVPGIESKTLLAFEPAAVTRATGYTTLTGDVVQRADSPN